MKYPRGITHSMPRTSFVNAIQQDGKLVFLYRSKRGQMMAVKVPAEYIVFFKTSEISKHQSALRKSRFVSSYKIEGEWTRVRFIDWEARKRVVSEESPLVQAGIKPYEGDVHPIRRYITDHGIEIDKPRRCYLDIETDSRVPFHEKEKARVLCWTVTDDDANVVGHGVLEAETDAAEAALLRALWRCLDDYDQILAWYGGDIHRRQDGFDFPVIWARSKQVGAAPKAIERWLYLDQLALFQRMNMHAAASGEEKQSMKLQAIAMAMLGEGKDNFNAAQTYEAWLNNTDCGSKCGKCRACMARYNIQDTKLLPKLEKKTGYADLFQAICEVCRCFPETRHLKPTFQVDGFMLRLGLERGIHFNTVTYGGPEQEQYEGAFVMEPTERGILKGVHVADFASMYPSIIRTWNMSPDTKIAIPINGPIPPGTCRNPGNREGFTTEREGLLPFALRELQRLRKYWSDLKASLTPGTPEWYEADRKSNGYKVTGNSFYGVMGAASSRFYDRAIAEGTTSAGVWLIKKTIEIAAQQSMRTIYGDTDSIFVTGATSEGFRNFVKELNTKHYPKLISDTGATENYISIAYEKEFERIIIVGKKRAVGMFAHYKGKLATSDTKPEVKGLEYKRGDTTVLARTLQGEVIHRLMIDRCEEPTELEEMIEGWKMRILEGDLTRDDVVIVKGISKNLSEYVSKKKNNGEDASLLPHIMLAKELLRRRVIATRKTRGVLDVPAGTRIEYIIKDSTTSPATVVWAEDWKPEDGCDRFYIWENQVWPPTMRLLEAAFPAHDWSRFNKVRPRKKSARKGGAGEGQMALSFSEPTTTRVVVTDASVPAMPRRRPRHKGADEEAKRS